MRRVFADAYFYLALFNTDDEGYEAATQFAAIQRAKMVTTEWVLMEVADAAAKPPRRHRFRAFHDRIRSNPNTILVAASTELFAQGLELYDGRPDKEWSLTDCISFEVMKSFAITEALTADHHFEQAGFVALLK